jgi:hydroxyethylthiazole kinase-like uncharacterized protein yjeF
MIPTAESRILDVNSKFLGVPAATLMENAGKGVTNYIAEKFERSDVIIVCGTGNNGGDGAVAARHLKDKGWNVALALLRSRSEIKSRILLQNLDRLPEDVAVMENAEPEAMKGFPIILDCMLGTGIKDRPREPYAAWINAMNKTDATIISVDVPSGLGTPLAVKPDVTISMHDSKEGMTPENSGEIVIVDIGIPKDAIDYVGPGEFTYYPIPERDSHKGQNGRLLIVGGGPYTGAPALSALAALRTGADLVWIAVPERCYQVVASYSPDYIVKALGGPMLTPDDLPLISELIASVDAVLVGPGLGRDEETVRTVCQFVKDIDKPLVVDADGLYAISALDDLSFKIPTVLTPHRKEFQRLNPSIDQIDENAVSGLAKKLGATIVLKAPVDIITDGERIKRNRTGNPAMSVGGTGDALAGIIAALLAKGAGPFDAARMGAYLSGKSGDTAFEIVGYSMTASDVIASIPLALKDVLGHVR